MKIHTNQPAVDGHLLRSILREETTAGRLAAGVYFERLDRAGSQSHHHSLDFKLAADEYAVGRRRGSGGPFGPRDAADYSLTYDEWGWVITRILDVDPEAVFGGVKTPTYAGREHFDERTGYTYNPAVLVRLIEQDGDPYPWVFRPQRGAVGRNRKAEPYGSVYTFAPRTVADVVSFARLELAVAA